MLIDQYIEQNNLVRLRTLGPNQTLGVPAYLTDQDPEMNKDAKWCLCRFEVYGTPDRSHLVLINRDRRLFRVAHVSIVPALSKWAQIDADHQVARLE